MAGHVRAGHRGGVRADDGARPSVLEGDAAIRYSEHGGGVSVLLHRPEEQGLRTHRAKVQRGQGADRRLRAHR